MTERASREEGRAARALVGVYHEAELAGLIEHVSDAIDRYRAGELDAYEVDEIIHQYHKATIELWKFCFRGGSGSYAGFVASALEAMAARGERHDWWAAGERRRG